MKSRLPFVLVLAGLAGCGLTSLAINAYADPVSSQTSDQSSASESDQSSSSDVPAHVRFSDADRAAFLDARIAALHAGLVLTPAQEKLWPSVESALRETHKVIADQRAARRNNSASGRSGRVAAACQRQHIGARPGVEEIGRCCRAIVFVAW